MDTELYKIRSLAKCITAGYDLFSTNFKKIFRNTWIPILLLSATVAGLQILISTLSNLQAPDFTNYAYNLSVVIGILVFAFVAMTMSAKVLGNMVSLLNGEKKNSNFIRMLKLTFFSFALSIVIGIIILGLASIPEMLSREKTNLPDFAASIFIVVGTMLILLLCTPPFIYSATKYFMEPKQKIWSVIGKPYARGWRHWGFLFGIAVLTTIIMTVIYFVVIMPFYTLLFATQFNRQGLQLGDPSGLPSYFPILLFVVTVVCTFIWYYVAIWQITVFYYAYGTVEAKMAARKQPGMPIASASDTLPEIKIEE